MSYETSTDLESVQEPALTRDSLFGYAVDGLNGAGSLLIFAVMALMCADVLSRNLIDRPIEGVAELVAISIVAIVFLQLASALRHGRMSRADLFIDGFVQRHPHAGHSVCAAFNLAGAMMLAVVCYATWPTFVLAWIEGEFIGVEGVFTAPIWPVKLIVLVGSTMTAGQYLLLAVHEVGKAVAAWREKR